tara:strand:+ start:537 stop:782 length:246 start_codon:yes stop_codon:yes gene_type:complete
MVKILDNNNFKKLIRIAEQTVGTHHVTANHTLEIVKLHEAKLCVHESSLYVKEEGQLDLAMDLAKKYEQALGREFTIRKQY